MRIPHNFLPQRTNSRYIKGMWGLGDNIFARPFVRELAKDGPLFLETPWPELYEDIENVFFVKGTRNLRTQTKNVNRQEASRWAAAPKGNPTQIGYNMRAGSIIDDLAKSFGLPNFKPELDLPRSNWEQTLFNSKPIAIIRPVTMRTEWNNEARNPFPEYIYQCAERLMTTHHVVLVGDIATGETLLGNLPPHHDNCSHGELNIRHLLALVIASDVIVGGVGWIVPAAIAARRRAFIVLGGQGGHNAPEKITAPYWGHKLWFCFPDKFCRCTNMRHQCAKSISNLSLHFENFLSRAN